jgi:hypothetical protein
MRGKARIEPGAWEHDAEAIWPDDPDLMGTRSLGYRLGKRALAMAEARRDDHGAGNTEPSRLRENIRHRRRRRGYHDEVGNKRE